MKTGFFEANRAFGAILLFAVLTPAFAEPGTETNADARIVPVEHAPFHQLVFANEDISVLKNLYPPGGDSGFHGHYRDLLYVVIEGAQSRSQSPGKTLTAATMTPTGAAGYSPIGAEPRVHRVVNADKGAFQIIVVEIRRASPSGKGISSRENAPQYVQFVDNPKARAWRLILDPGQSVPAIVQEGEGVRVVVRGGLLTTAESGLPEQTLALQAGDFAVQRGGASRALRNSGTETIELVELELK